METTAKMSGGMRRHLVMLVVGVLGLAASFGVDQLTAVSLYTSEGMIHIKPQTKAVLFDIPGQPPAFESHIAAQVTLLKSEHVVDMALSSGRWEDLGRGNSPAVTAEFRGNLSIKRDGEMIAVVYSDRDATVAVAGVRALIEAYNRLYLGNESENASVAMHQLEGLRDQYTARLRTLSEQIGTITSGAGADAVENRYKQKVEEASQLESAWHLAQRSLQEWNALHAAATVSPKEWKIANAETIPTDPKAVHTQAAPAELFTQENAGPRLKIQEELLRQQYEVTRDETRTLGKIVTQINGFHLDIEEIRSWLATAKVRIEQITVEAAANGRINVISSGDRPVVQTSRPWSFLPGAFAAVHGIFWLMMAGLWQRKTLAGS